MQIGELVTFDDGAGEGILISVIGPNAIISTNTGPVQRPIRHVKSIAVQVIACEDNVGMEEVLEVVQRHVAKEPIPDFIIQPVEEDDGDLAAHAALLQAEAEQIAAGEPKDEGVVRVGGPGNEVAYLPEGGLLDNFNDMENVETDDYVPLPDLASSPHVSTLPPEEKEEIGDVKIVIPRRFGKKWLAAQDTETLKRCLQHFADHPDIPKARLVRMQAELDSRGA